MRMMMMIIIIIITHVECESKSDTRKYLSNIPGKKVIKEPQKTAILGTVHILR
jgi:uncharacterized lipoprotein YehR (DUF1307 family)